MTGDVVTGEIAFVEVDQPPLRYPSYGHVELTSDYDDLDERLTKALVAVAEQTDDAHCGNPECDRMIGYTLAGDADEYTVWNYTFVLAHGKSTRALCEDCAASLTVWMF